MVAMYFVTNRSSQYRLIKQLFPVPAFPILSNLIRNGAVVLGGSGSALPPRGLLDDDEDMDVLLLPFMVFGGFFLWIVVIAMIECSWRSTEVLCGKDKK